MNNAQPKLKSLIESAIDRYRRNDAIMSFCRNQACVKVACEIRAEMGGGTPAKAVELLECRHDTIADRVRKYTEIALIGCFAAWAEKNWGVSI